MRSRPEGVRPRHTGDVQPSLARELHALEADGLVVSRREAGDGKPDKKIYALTAAGRLALDTWLQEPLEPMQLRHPLLLKLVFAADVPPHVLDDVLARYAASLEDTRAEYEVRLSSQDIFSLARSRREADIWRLSIEHGLGWCEHELSWVARARKTLQSAGPGQTSEKARAGASRASKECKR